MPPAVDVLVAGAGLAGAVVAERLAAEHGLSCLVVERRRHLGGLCHDAHDEAGVLVPSYGPHYFRTDSDRVADYLSQFTDWRPAEYRVLVSTHGRLWPFPINLDTYEQLVGHAATSTEMEAALAAWREPLGRAPANSEEYVVAQVGRALYEMFYRGYTRKQWGREPAELDPSVAGRIPIRTDRDPRYLRERFQAMPRLGYTRLCERLLAHPRVAVLLGADARAVRAAVPHRHLVYTGPLDEYFDRALGPLPYRSLRFEHATLEVERYQPVVQVNYPNDHEYTRIIEPKHITGQRLPCTSIVREYPAEAGDPYYAVPTPDALALAARYAARAAAEPEVSFVGRLASYRNQNMDQVVLDALHLADRLGPRLRAASA